MKKETSRIAFHLGPWMMNFNLHLATQSGAKGKMFETLPLKHRSYVFSSTCFTVPHMNQPQHQRCPQNRCLESHCSWNGYSATASTPSPYLKTSNFLRENHWKSPETNKRRHWTSNTFHEQRGLHRCWHGRNVHLLDLNITAVKAVNHRISWFKSPRLWCGWETLVAPWLFI